MTTPETDRSDPNALRFLIGRELRNAREQARMVQRQASKHLGCTQVKIAYLESGRNEQTPHDITRLMQLYGADEVHTTRLAALASQADQAIWWAPYGDAFPDWFRTFVGLEGLATSIFTYEPALLPGQLQTPEYARALLDGHLEVAPKNAPHVVEARMARQRLTTTKPLKFCAVLEEVVLDRLIGGPTVMRSQLEHLLKLTRLENVELHVIPLSVAVHDGLDGDFMLLNFDSAQSIGYIEYPAGALYVQEPDRIQLYKMAADRLCRAALTPSETADAITKRINTLTDKERQ